MSSTKYLDHTTFKEYTKDSCYWAGLLAADGCIDVNGTITLELEGKDYLTIEAFKKYCKAEHDISYRESTNSYRIRFVSKEIKDDLLFNFSVSVGKTKNLEVPILLEDWQYAAYYRGFFDGDGCFTEFFNNRPMATYRVALTNGSLNFLETTLDLLRTKHIIEGGCLTKKATNCWDIQLAVKDSTSFLNWIYSVEGHRFSRKYDKYYSIVVLGNRARKAIE